MSEPTERIAGVRRWAEKAEHDLLAAEHDMQLAERGLTDVVCFHCQQCAEKYLKALLILHGVHFPKTHDLRLLMELIPDQVGFRLTKPEVVPLNRYAIEGRYPGEWEPIGVEEARMAITMARGIRDEARRLLPAEAYKDEG